MPWVVDLFLGAAAAVMVQRILAVRFGVAKRLIVTALSVAAAAVIASQLVNVAALEGAAVALVGSILLAAVAAVSLEAAGGRALNSRSWTVRVALLPREVGQRVSRARRYAQITTIITRHGLGAYLGIGRGSEEMPRDRQLGKNMREAFEECGGVFVKFGQVLSNRTDLLPAAVAGELRRLHEHVGEEPLEAISRALTRDLGADVAVVFRSFDPHPVAAGSIAQVHRAQLHDGRAVAVKIQRPGIARSVERDLRIVERLAVVADTAWESGRRVRVADLARGFTGALREELDFRIEARNAGVLAEHLDTANSGVSVPAVVAELSGARVLVSEWVDGVSLADAAAQAGGLALDGNALAKALLASLLDQILIQGVFHADPHPGNIFLTPTRSLVLLDLGSVARIDRFQQAGLRKVLFALSRKDPKTMTDAVLELAEVSGDTDETRLRRALAQFMTQHLGTGLSPEVSMFAALFRLLLDHGLAFPKDLGAVFRSLMTLQGSLAVLDPDFNILEESQAAAKALLADALQPRRLANTVHDDLISLLPVLERLPRRVDRVGAALETGRLVVNVRLFSDASEATFVRQLVNRAILAVLVAADGFVSVQLLAAQGGPHLAGGLTVLQATGYVGLIGGLLLFMRLLVAILRDR